jgi:HNH endonuclease
MSKTYIAASLRRKVTSRAQGCCEYCLKPEILSFSPHEVDHTIAEKHGGRTTEVNLALACKLCNIYKGSDIASIDPQTNEVTPLYNPRRDRWSEHFQLAPTAEFVALSSQARATIRILQLNRVDRVEERRLWMKAGII